MLAAPLALVPGRGRVPVAPFALGGTAAVRVSVVIPALNEAANLPAVLPRIPAWVDEVLLVDGQSTDATVAVAKQLRPDIRVLVEARPGKGRALRRGLAAAQGDLVLLLDADGSTAPEELPAFVGALLSGADVVKGSRFVQGGGSADLSWLRRVGNRLLVRLVRLAFGGQYTDLCYGYTGLWRAAVGVLGLEAEGFEIETELTIRALRAGLAVAEVASFEASRLHGASHLRTGADGWRVLRTILRERFRPAPSRYASAAQTAVEER